LTVTQIPTVDELRGCGWKRALENKHDYQEMRSALSAASAAAEKAGDGPSSRALTLLADLSSMMLTPASSNEPFKPVLQMEGRRSSIPGDFGADAVAVLAQFVDHVDHIALRARIADVVWLLQKPRDPRFAELAIEAYSQFALSVSAWTRGTRDAWGRAISLARSIKARERVESMEVSLLNAFEKTSKEDGFFALWIAEMLKKQGLARTKATAVGAKLQALAAEFESVDVHRSGKYYEAAATWYQRADDLPSSAAMVSKSADLLLVHARAASSALAASHFIEKAIHALRSIPKAERALFNVDERIAACHKELDAAGKQSLEEMMRIESPGVDVTAEVARSEAAVRGQPAMDALFNFASISRGAKAASIRSAAEEMLRNSPFRALISGSHLAGDGRVIAKTPGVDFDNPKSFETTVWAEMIRHYGIHMQVEVQAAIWPALQVLVHEHRLVQEDFAEIAGQSPVVPHGRGGLIAKALAAGFDRDFVTALHIAAPQLEHIVRVRLKAAGAKTTTLSQQGIETENGLSTLMEMTEAEKIFGPDVTFEIRALFCDAFGSNLRNEIAHGLLNESSFYSHQAVYAWWWFFRLVFIPHWTLRRQQPPGEGPSPSAS
jgi:hypothetical protein